MKTFIIKYKCQFCSRLNFEKPMPHKCVGGYRRRKLIWHQYLVPNQIVLVEKFFPDNPRKNDYYFILKNTLPFFSLNSYLIKRKGEKNNEETI